MLDKLRWTFGHFRLKDDIFVVARADAEMSLERVQALAKPHWQITSDPIGRYGAVMLDTKVYKGPRLVAGGVLLFTKSLEPPS